MCPRGQLDYLLVICGTNDMGMSVMIQDIFNFKATYGRPLVSLRLVGHNLTSVGTQGLSCVLVSRELNRLDQLYRPGTAANLPSI